LEKNTGLQILKRRLQKLRQDSDTRVNGDDGDQSLANGGNNNYTDNADWVCAQPKEEGAKSEHALDGSNNNNVSKSALHRAHSCSSLFGLQQNIVNRHRRLSCSGQVVTILDLLAPVTTTSTATEQAINSSKSLKPIQSCKKNSFIQFISPAVATGCFDVC